MKLPYRPDIDGLRAIAVLAVVGYHAFPEFFPGGFIGVDVFFVISGYLITSILVAEHARGQWRLSDFYARRILRIFPALILVLLACFLAGWFLLLADEYKQLGKHIAAGAGFFANFSLWFESGYFDRASEFKPLLHLWSLGIEEQFYIVWPLLLWLLWRFHTQLKSVLGGLVAVSLLVATALVFTDRTAAFYAPWSRAWELALGALLALGLSQRWTVWLDRFGRVRVLSLAWVLLGVGVFFLHANDPFPGATALIPTAAACLVIVAGTQAVAVPPTWLSSRPLVFVGLISYPLYLWHWPLLSFARILEAGEIGTWARLLCVLMAGVLATATYYGVEKPIRAIRRSISLPILILLMALMALLGWNVHHRDGLERIRHKRMIHLDESYRQDFADFETTGLFNGQSCDQPFKFPEKDVCLVADAAQPVTAVVLGDSHAVHAYWGLSQTFAREGQNLKVMGKGACMPLLGYPKQSDVFGCQPHMDTTLRAVAHDTKIQSVAMVFRGKYLGASPDPSSVSAYASALDDTLRLLTHAGKKVYFFLPVVEPGFDPRLCVGTLPMGRKPPRSCVMDLADQETKGRVFREASLSVITRYRDVTVVDPNQLLCPSKQCSILQEGHSVFKDDNHLSYHGSMMLGRGLRLRELSQ